MSRSTPRKAARHKRQSSNLIPAVSDYESDAAAAAGLLQKQHYEAPPPRTNTELNVSVLKRYVPSIHKILSIAANAVVYAFDSAAGCWDKSGVEGTLFVCTQTPLPRACVFVLNRRGLGNVIVDLARVSHVEVVDELLIIRVEEEEAQGQGQQQPEPRGGAAGGGGGGGGGQMVLGIWIHNDREETRQVNAAMVQDCWGIARSAGTVDHQRQEAGPAMQAIGRPLTLNELFGSQEAANQGQ